RGGTGVVHEALEGPERERRRFLQPVIGGKELRPGVSVEVTVLPELGWNLRNADAPGDERSGHRAGRGDPETSELRVIQVTAEFRDLTVTGGVARDDRVPHDGHELLERNGGELGQPLFELLDRPRGAGAARVD